jgi:polyhydroxyalkanoate synthase
VLGGSGHIAGVISPAGSKKYGYWTNPKLPGDSEAWLAGATQHEGSWWTDWLNWMKRRSGKKVPAQTPGDGGLAVIEDAPGSYVKVRSGSS